MCIREDSYRAFIVDAERERLRMVKGIKRNESPALDEVRNAITPELIDRIKKEINEANVTDEHIEALARSVGLDWMCCIRGPIGCIANPLTQQQGPWKSFL